MASISPEPLQNKECDYRITQESNGKLACQKDAMAMWDTALWKLERCLRVGHNDVHQKNFLPGLEGDWNQQADRNLCSPDMATYVHEMHGHMSSAMQRWAKY